ncbi:MAG: hypothetical protein JXR03_00170 [Cyclobacteriaceae bacterium]
MTDLNMLNVSSQDNVETSYTTSVSAIQAYTTGIAGQSNTGVKDLDAILTTAKTNAANWYNTIYPGYLAMPGIIIGRGKTIDDDLTLLIQLANQLKSSDTPAIRASITQYVNSLVKELSQLEKEITNLSIALGTFKNNLSTTTDDFLSEKSAISQKLFNYHNTICQYAAQLQAEKSAVCPNQNDIKNTQAALNNTVALRKQYDGYSATFINLFNASSLSCQGASSVSAYWVAMAKDFSNCITGLSKISTEPSAILLLDLNSNKKSWEAIKTQMASINTATSLLIKS